MYCGVIHGVTFSVLQFVSVFRCFVVYIWLFTARAMVCLVDGDALSLTALCCFAGHTRLWYDYSLNLISRFLLIFGSGLNDFKSCLVSFLAKYC